MNNEHAEGDLQKANTLNNFFISQTLADVSNKVLPDIIQLKYVSLFPLEKCSCSALDNCYHIQAAKMSIGQTPQSGKRILNMSRIKSTSKKRQNRHAGQKKPRPIDIYDANQCVVNLPPDALVNTTCNEESRYNVSALHEMPPNFATSTPMVKSATKTPKSIIKKDSSERQRKSAKECVFTCERTEGLPEGKLLSTVHEELDNDRGDSFCQVLPELDDIVKGAVGTNNSATSEPTGQAVSA